MASFAQEPVILSEDVIRAELKKHPLWSYEDNKLCRTFRAKNFKSAIDFISAVGAIADKYKVHPDISISESKKVDIRVYNQEVKGVTNQDFDMITRYDTVPVNYSIFWRKQNADLFDTATARNPEWDQTASYVRRKETLSGHPERAALNQHHHRPRDIALVPTSVDGHDSVHSSHSATRTTDGSLLHPHGFRVTNTAHSMPKGQGDGKYNIQHAHSFSDTNHIRVNESGASPSELNSGFAAMAHALHSLESQGYDAAICETFIPMFEQGRVVPGYSDDLKRAYHHFQQRAGEWAKEEPEAVVEASKEFLSGYGVVSRVYENLADV